MRLGEAVRTGALAGLGGAAAVTTANLIEQQLFLPRNEPFEIEPIEVAKTEARNAGHPLSTGGQWAAGTAAHLAYSALWGAIYGVAQRRLRLPHLLHGVVFGEIIWALNYPRWGILPQRGILPPAGERSRTRALIPLGTHAVFGLATAALFQLLSRHADRG
ncbi:MAG: hypothetical protein H0W67_03415 [Gemmatimonadales bacterium]|nr:hypothetical protein [Gemmatimonadales bacterium]